jgi:hypothetical protein
MHAKTECTNLPSILARVVASGAVWLALAGVAIGLAVFGLVTRANRGVGRQITQQVTPVVSLGSVLFSDRKQVAIGLPFDKTYATRIATLKTTCGCISLVDTESPADPCRVRLQIIADNASRSPEAEVLAFDQRGQLLAKVLVSSTIEPPFDGWPTSAVANIAGEGLEITFSSDYQNIIADARLSTGVGRSPSIWDRTKCAAVVPRYVINSDTELVVEFGPDRVRWSGPISLSLQPHSVERSFK